MASVLIFLLVVFIVQTLIIDFSRFLFPGNNVEKLYILIGTFINNLITLNI